MHMLFCKIKHFVYAADGPSSVIFNLACILLFHTAQYICHPHCSNPSHLLGSLLALPPSSASAPKSTLSFLFQNSNYNPYVRMYHNWFWEQYLGPLKSPTSSSDLSLQTPEDWRLKLQSRKSLGVLPE